MADTQASKGSLSSMWTPRISRKLSISIIELAILRTGWKLKFP